MYEIPPHCPYNGTVPVAAVVLVLAALVVVLVFTVLVVVLDLTLVVNVVPVVGFVDVVEDFVDVEAAVDVVPTTDVEADPPHPTRVELIAISSYQKVLTSPLYDSHPKYTPVIFGMMVLLAHPLSFRLPLVNRPGIAALFNHVSMLPSVPRWYSKHSQAPVGRATEVATP